VKKALMDPSYRKEQKEFAIQRSLTGSAARLVMYQGHDKAIDKIGGYEDIAVACWCLILGLTAASSVVVGKVSE
jgi:hypothetical protein